MDSVGQPARICIRPWVQMKVDERRVLKLHLEKYVFTVPRRIVLSTYDRH